MYTCEHCDHEFREDRNDCPECGSRNIVVSSIGDDDEEEEPPVDTSTPAPFDADSMCIACSASHHECACPQ